MAQISRDPFARTELHRSTISVYSRGCDWCDGVRRPKGSKKFSLFVYRTEDDGGRVSEHRGAFCCKSCHDAYHG